MTRWVALHPGGAKKITQFAVEGGMILTYPHPEAMDRWENNKQYFSHAGLFNDKAAFHSFPPMLQLKSVIEYFNLESAPGDNVIVCGSPNEIANDQSLGDTGLGMSIGDNMEDLIYYDKLKQRQIVWLRTALSADDQLRQRVAWALRQIFATSPETVLENEQTEGFLHFYDIFVRHAFGNFFDILKEISYR